MIVKMIQNLGNRMEKIQEMFNKDQKFLMDKKGNKKNSLEKR